MKDYPLVTIFLLTNNGEKTVEKSLYSLINQTYPNLEIIVSDNYSSDKTPEIIKSLQDKNKDKDKNIIYKRNDPPAIKDDNYIGCYANYNSCINSNLIRAEFVSFCHDDDIYEKNFIEKEIDFLISHPDAGGVFTMANIIDENDKLIGQRKLPKKFRGRNLYVFSDIFNEFLNNGNV
jgi:glycosyltransferase involved in cell wall biosynthesis